MHVALVALLTGLGALILVEEHQPGLALVAVYAGIAAVVTGRWFLSERRRFPRPWTDSIGSAA